MTRPQGESSERLTEWEQVSSEPRHEYIPFQTRRDRVRDPGGEIQEYDIIESADAVTVIALTPDGDLVMVEQFRQGSRAVELEFPGGVIDPGEAPLDCGVRELQEETGYAGDDAEMLGTLLLNPSWETTRVHVVRVRAAEPRSEKELDEGEDTRVRLVPVEEVRRRVAEGSLASAVVVAALALHLWGRQR